MQLYGGVTKVTNKVQLSPGAPKTRNGGYSISNSQVYSVLTYHL